MWRAVRTLPASLGHMAVGTLGREAATDMSLACSHITLGAWEIMHTSSFFTGPGYQDLGLLALRVLLGVFFVLARFRWLYDPSRPDSPWLNAGRHEHLRWKLCYCGYGQHPLLVAFVACVEISAGCAIVLGLLTELALMGLMSILLFATWCTAKEKVCAQNPVDTIDYVSCYLWRVEGVYIGICAVLLLNGPGFFSLDHALGLAQ